jgi:hypothetical protein
VLSIIAHSCLHWFVGPYDLTRKGLVFITGLSLIDPPCALSIVKSEKLAKTLELYPSGRFCIKIPGVRDVFFLMAGSVGNALSFAFGWANTREQVQIKKEHQGGRNHPGGTKEGYED